jgi:hypothetical protein
MPKNEPRGKRKATTTTSAGVEGSGEKHGVTERKKPRLKTPPPPQTTTETSREDVLSSGEGTNDESTLGYPGGFVFPPRGNLSASNDPSSESEEEEEEEEEDDEEDSLRGIPETFSEGSPFQGAVFPVTREEANEGSLAARRGMNFLNHQALASKDRRPTMGEPSWVSTASERHQEMPLPEDVVCYGPQDVPDLRVLPRGVQVLDPSLYVVFVESTIARKHKLNPGRRDDDPRMRSEETKAYFLTGLRGVALAWSLRSANQDVPWDYSDPYWDPSSEPSGRTTPSLKEQFFTFCQPKGYRTMLDAQLYACKNEPGERPSMFAERLREIRGRFPHFSEAEVGDSLKKAFLRNLHMDMLSEITLERLVEVERQPDAPLDRMVAIAEDTYALLSLRRGSPSTTGSTDGQGSKRSKRTHDKDKKSRHGKEGNQSRLLQIPSVKSVSSNWGKSGSYPCPSKDSDDEEESSPSSAESDEEDSSSSSGGDSKEDGNRIALIVKAEIRRLKRVLEKQQQQIADLQSI